MRTDSKSKNVFNPEDIKVGDYVVLEDEPNNKPMKVIEVFGRNNNKILCEGLNSHYYANCFKKVS